MATTVASKLFAIHSQMWHRQLGSCSETILMHTSCTGTKEMGLQLWSKFVFSHESTFTIKPTSLRKRVWRKEGARYKPVNLLPTFKSGYQSYLYGLRFQSWKNSVDTYWRKLETTKIHRNPERAVASICQYVSWWDKLLHISAMWVLTTPCEVFSILSRGRRHWIFAMACSESRYESRRKYVGYIETEVA